MRKVAGLKGNRSSLIVVLGCLKTFYDEEVPVSERRAFLKKTLTLLKEISQKGKKVLVTSVDPPARVRDRFESLLLQAADRAARLEADQDGSLGIRLIKGIEKKNVGQEVMERG